MNGTQQNGQQQNHKGADLKHRHSLHTTHVNHLRINDADLANGFEAVLRNGHGPQRSTSTDHCRQPDKKYSVVSEHSTGSSSNRFLKWLGFGQGDEKRALKEIKEKDLIAAHKEYKRRMSTFT
ncbi:hypothetical protein WR25_04547 [Diploscapter pachys]|uniref:Uncharacterized protein n=1 Tax=Diploscapter pachys TaxID=2018661 RepID=A0A2A2KR76_9BILA|nr:hypothetical protein WR25_16960 [Diploscapter pachys]PAV85138.1 hypothetical protein WR25_04547 [Diploscapter pachys]